jgi:transcription-repair coupling factor (superfamily II helicase)
MASSPIKVPTPPTRAGRTSRWGQLYGAAFSLAVIEAAKSHPAPVVVITPSVGEADQLRKELDFFAGSEIPVMQMPDWETLPYDVFSPHPDITSERITTLHKLPGMRSGVLVIAAATLIQRLPPRSYIDGSSLVIQTGDNLELNSFRLRLESAGYTCVSQVMEHGEFAVRGSLIDLFPMGSELPFRIDLFDNEIDTIRSFQPSDQRTEEKLETVELLPAREFPLNEPGISGFRQRFRARFDVDHRQAMPYRDVSAGNAGNGIEYYLALFFDELESLFDYLPEQTLLVEANKARDVFPQVWQDMGERFESRRHDIERPLLSPHEIALEPGELEQNWTRFPSLSAQSFELTPDQSESGVNFSSKRPPQLAVDHRSEDPAKALFDFLDGFGGRVLIAAESTGRREAMLDLLKGRGKRVPVTESWQHFLASNADLAITVAPLENGLLLESPALAIIAEGQLFGDRAKQQQRRRRRSERDPEAIIRDLTDLRAGAPVVHETCGIGRYLGLEIIEAGGRLNEFLALEYAGSDKLYVPVHDLHLISRYTGAAVENAPLHRLGSEQWSRAKKRAAEKIRDVAAELLDLYARRAARQGQQYKIDQREYLSFQAEFPFDETVDQAQAIEAVLEDMAGPQPMDRVVCGDVGFGKTEVALRAAFIAVQNQQQVAVLVPTTLLAQQHYQTFVDRFADWPVRIEVLSRFRSNKETEKVLKGLADGRVDIVIGTHKLLQPYIKFKQLGLVIVDEEHRFGVRQKERLKSLRAEVDLLTLTATPIPRTLNMALGGLRGLSLITTPPEERLAVKTFVSEWNDSLIREACLREIKRGGQIYFLHNEVTNIEQMAARLGELIPEARIRVGHGQMRERDLEQVMLDFYHRRFNLLVCTTIVESGIHVPTANTIIINRADRLGLAQLHQLRGRVGRSHHRAYAYMVAPPRAVMTADAIKRLEAIESLEELGAGFTLATHDLEIRGAGELLGDGQSGQIQEIGFSLYMDLLERAVNAIKAGKDPDLEKPLDHGPEVELGIPALLPEDFMPDVHMRLILYKRIASAGSEQELRDLQVEMIDRFGLLPEISKTLFRIAEVKLCAQPLGIRRIEASAGGGRLMFAEGTSVDPLSLIKLIQSQSRRYSLEGPDVLRIRDNWEEPEKRLEQIMKLLAKLAPDPSTTDAGTS